MKKVFKVILILLLFFSFSVDSNASCIKKLKVISPSGKTYFVEVTFTSGYELNEKTYSNNYTENKGYATIFWGEGKATVIELTYCLVNFSPRLSRFDCTVLEMWKDAMPEELMEGYDQRDEKWQLLISY